MKLIANRPCSFGGRQFYIGDEIPANLVADAKAQQKMGVLAIVENEKEVSGEKSGTFLSSEDMVELQEYRKLGITPQQMREIDESYAILAKELGELKSEMLSIGEFVIHARGWDYVENGGVATEVPVTSNEIKMVFGILQMTAEESIKAIADVKEENILVLLYAADSRKTVKNAAKEQADKLFSTKTVSNESTGDNEAIGTNTKGVDA